MSGPGSRVVRVFISSTFRDFQEERRLLVNEVFPELRRRARARHVEVVEVDLRWGITEQEADRGDTLAICLREIERARPYFVGMLGERYGWVPKASQVPGQTIEAYPWLRDRIGLASVTEFEILSCVLRASVSDSRALFYFRVPRFAEERGPNFRSEDPRDIERLDQLKSLVEDSQLPLVRNYPDPGAFAAQALEDLWRRIDLDFPEQSVPSGLEREHQLHQAWADGRRRVLVQRQTCLDDLDRAADQTATAPDDRGSETVAVIGAAGVGKSALLAAWASRRAKAFPADLVFEHYGQADGGRGDVGWVLAHLRAWVSEVSGSGSSSAGPLRPIEVVETDELSDAPIDGVLEELSRIAIRAGRRAIVVLDGLAVEPDGRWGWWIPAKAPPGVKLVVAPAGEGSRAFSATRFARLIEVGELTIAERQQLVDRVLAHHFKRLPSDSVMRIAESTISGRPGTLRWMLEEMRRSASHDELGDWIARIRACGSEADWVDFALERLEHEFSDGSAVRFLTTLALASTGIHVNDLAEIAGIAPRSVALLEHRLGELLESGQSRLRIAGDNLQSLVRRRLLPTPEVLRQQALRDAAWWLCRLESRHATPDQAVTEAVSLLLQAQDHGQIREWMMQPSILWNLDCLSRELRERIVGFADRASVDLESVVSDALRDRLGEFCDGVAAPARVLAISDMLAHARRFGAFHGQLLETAIRRAGGASDGRDMLLLRNARASLLQAKGQWNEACAEFMSALRARQAATDWPGADDMPMLSNLVVALVHAGRQAEALECAEAFIRVARSQGGVIARRTEAILSSSRAVILRRLGKPEAALQHSQDALDLLNRFDGLCSSSGLIGVGNHALILLDLNRPVEAERLLRSQLPALRDQFGSNSAQHGRQVALLARAMAVQGASDQAILVLRDAVSILASAPGGEQEHATALNQMAALLSRRGDLDGAIAALQALLAQLKLNPAFDPELEERTLHDLARAFSTAGRFAEAADSWMAIFRLLGGERQPQSVVDDRAEQLLMLLINAMLSRKMGGLPCSDLIKCGRPWRARVAQLLALSPEVVARRQALCTHFDAFNPPGHA